MRRFQLQNCMDWNMMMLDRATNFSIDGLSQFEAAEKCAERRRNAKRYRKNITTLAAQMESVQ